MARKQYDQQTREARVGPVILANRALVQDRLAEEASTTLPVQEHTLEERAREREAKAIQLRPALVDFVATRKETVEQKTVRLRKEYLRLHHTWISRCAELDGVPPGHGSSEEASVVSSNGRTTRRSAAVIGDAVRSDLEMEQIIASLGNEDMFDPALLAIRNVAKIPDMISVTQGRVDYVFDDTNNLVDDPASFYDPGPKMAAWTDKEQATFLAQYAAHPKQFGLIAEALPNKTQAQCVQFYYLHKKKLVDFRQAVTTFGRTKRRGGRRTAKKKGNALLADIRQHDAEVSRDSSVGPAINRRKRAAVRRSNLQVELTPMSTPTPEPEARPKRRRIKAGATQEQQDGEASESESRPAKRTRRTRKTKVSSELAEPDAEDQTTPVSASASASAPPKAEEGPRRRTASGPVHWSDEDKALFLALLSQHGDDFKRIAASMPNKTTVQVSAYYKAHAEELDLARVAANAPKRSPTPEASNSRGSSAMVFSNTGHASANIAPKKAVAQAEAAWHLRPSALSPRPDGGWPMVPLGPNPVDFAYSAPFRSIRPQGEPVIHIGSRPGTTRLPPVTATQPSYIPLHILPPSLPYATIPPPVGSHNSHPRSAS
ncbi:hypothetical protein OF83DRAFT_939962 [Amylostereum chailletii]|nr:hypothetical protein OF83DRAFT_939962 [Amylostereum chailletii]